jgi:glycolate oxidase FAD binding subunit
VSVLERVRALLGDEAVLDARTGPDGGGAPRVAPPSPEATALLLRAAHDDQWRVRVEGAGSWVPGDAPADLILTTRRLDRLVAVAPQDLSATVEAGLGCDLLRHQLADRGAWLAADPPGSQGRTIGSVAATATTGPLRHGFGPVRDHVLGVTIVTGDGRLIESGGRVVKNVAGYDLTKVQVGGFGAFGVIVRVHLRLRALPRADVTAVLEGARDDLARVADELLEAGLEPVALELVSPALARRDRWTLAVRFAGSAELVAAAEAGLRAASGGRFTELRAEEGAAFWRHVADGLGTRPVTLRLGGVVGGTEELLDLLQHQVGDEWITATPGVGAVRWAGDASIERLRHLRRALAALEVPLTLERAPWPVRSVVGHFGAYREGVGPLVSGLRRTFDPGQCLVVALGDTEGMEGTGGAAGTGGDDVPGN